MENKNEFNFKAAADQESDAQFRIEVADGDQGKFFSVRPLGHERFELSAEDGIVGTIQLDQMNHAHCESQGCELDLPLLRSIREQIQFHLKWNKEH